MLRGRGERSDAACDGVRGEGERHRGGQGSNSIETLLLEKQLYIAFVAFI